LFSRASREFAAKSNKERTWATASLLLYSQQKGSTVMSNATNRGRWPMTRGAYTTGLLLVFIVPLLIVILIALRVH
jgi:hypothetical protein